jgi:hypothetical protein
MTKPNSEDEKYNAGLGVCIIRKSVNVTKWLWKEWSLPVVCVLGILIIVSILNFLIVATFPYFQYAMMTLRTLNPLVYVALAILLPIPIYSTFWCIWYRRRVQTKKAFEEEPVCPIPNTGGD